MRQLLDHRLLASLPDHWESLCTIQTITYTVSASGQRVPSGGTPVPGMVNIPCRIGPIILTRPTDDEIRGPEIQENFTRRHLKLSRYLPQIQPRIMQAVVDGVTYPIRGNEADSARLCSRLRLEVVKP